MESGNQTFSNCGDYSLCRCFLPRFLYGQIISSAAHFARIEPQNFSPMSDIGQEKNYYFHKCGFIFIL